MHHCALFLVLPALCLAACGGGDDDGGTTDPPEALELTAVWELRTSVTSNTCGMPNGQTDTDRIILMQCGNRADVIAGPGLWGSATISGREVSFATADGRRGILPRHGRPPTGSTFTSCAESGWKPLLPSLARVRDLVEHFDYPELAGL